MGHSVFSTHLVNGKANGVHVLALAAMASPVLLHKSHQEAAGHFIVLWIIIFLQQSYLVLGVDPECICANLVTRSEFARLMNVFPLYFNKKNHYRPISVLLTAIGLSNTMAVADVYLLCRIHFEKVMFISNLPNLY